VLSTDATFENDSWKLGGGEAASAQRPLSFFQAGPWRPSEAHAERAAHAPSPRRGELT
jgi:hypothetical protein